MPTIDKYEREYGSKAASMAGGKIVGFDVNNVFESGGFSVASHD